MDDRLKASKLNVFKDRTKKDPAVLQLPPGKGAFGQPLPKQMEKILNLTCRYLIPPICQPIRSPCHGP